MYSFEDGDEVFVLPREQDREPVKLIENEGNVD